jgi:hypothetical protein
VAPPYLTQDGSGFRGVRLARRQPRARESRHRVLIREHVGGKRAAGEDGADGLLAKALKALAGAEGRARAPQDGSHAGLDEAGGLGYVLRKELGGAEDGPRHCPATHHGRLETTPSSAPTLGDTKQLHTYNQPRPTEDARPLVPVVSATPLTPHPTLGG